MYFQGHFLNNLIFPGVLILESMAQAAFILTNKSFENKNINKQSYLVSIDRSKFRKKIIPGDQMVIHVILNKIYKNLIRFSGQVFVETHLVSEAVFSCMFDEKKII